MSPLPTPPSAENLHENLTSFLKFYSEFSFFLCFSPYRYARDGSNFTARSWWPQRILCAVSTILGYFWLIRDVRLSVPKKEESRIPSRQFQVILSLCGFLIKTVTVRKLWFRPERFLNILNYITDEDTNLKIIGRPNGSNISIVPTTNKLNIFQNGNKIWVILICAMYTGISFLNFGMGRVLQISGDSSPTIANGTIINVTTHMSGDTMYSPNWWNRIVETSKFNFFLEASHNLDDTTEIIVGVLGAIGFFQRQVMGSFCDLLLLMGVLTFWTAARSFSKILEEEVNQQQIGLKRKDSISNTALMTKVQVVSLSYKKRLLQAGVVVSPGSGIVGGGGKWVEIEKYLRSLHILSSLMNSALGSNVTLFLVESVVYYSTSFDQVFFEDGPLLKNGAWAKKLGITFFFLNACTILVMAADISHQMNSLKGWLSLEENRDQVPVDQLHVILNEVDSNLVALKGSNIFPVTYPLLANMLSITVTYFIICVQA